VACASLGSFFVGYRFEPAVGCIVFPNPDLLAYPRFTALMAARFFGLMTPVRLAEAAGALAVLVATAIRQALPSDGCAWGFPAPRGRPGTRHFSYRASCYPSGADPVKEKLDYLKERQLNLFTDY
jgi:hypothetical protein